jgi:hypothetical protein
VSAADFVDIGKVREQKSWTMIYEMKYLLHAVITWNYDW